MTRPVSDCCHASLRVAGRTVTYWVCQECQQPCDASAYSSEGERRPVA
jgi:hypothetical protein